MSCCLRSLLICLQIWFVVRNDVDLAATTQSSGMVKLELAQLSYGSATSPGWRGDTFVADAKPRTDGPLEGVLLVQVQPGEKLKVEKFVGKTAAEVTGFTSAAKIYER